MTTDEIKLALRLVAMGRVNHPQVDELAEALAGVLARKCEPLPVVDMPLMPEAVEIVSIDEEVAEVRRTRRKKAD